MPFTEEYTEKEVLKKNSSKTDQGLGLLIPEVVEVDGNFVDWRKILVLTIPIKVNNFGLSEIQHKIQLINRYSMTSIQLFHSVSDPLFCGSGQKSSCRSGSGGIRGVKGKNETFLSFFS